jgi:hypothetical protein
LGQEQCEVASKAKQLLGFNHPIAARILASFFSDISKQANLLTSSKDDLFIVNLHS